MSSRAASRGATYIHKERGHIHTQVERRAEAPMSATIPTCVSDYRHMSATMSTLVRQIEEQRGHQDRGRSSRPLVLCLCPLSPHRGAEGPRRQRTRGRYTEE